MLKHLSRPAALLGIVLSISGCGTHRVYSSQDIADGTVIEHDKYQGLTYVRGLTLGSSMPGQFDHRQIAASLDGNGEVVESWIEYAEGGPDSPRQFIAAHDGDALPLKLERLNHSRETRANYATEEVAVDLPAGYLRAHQQTGIDIELEGRRGSQVVSFGPTYMDGFLPKLLTAQACVKAKAC
jgi:hypothetical protein